MLPIFGTLPPEVVVGRNMGRQPEYEVAPPEDGGGVTDPWVPEVRGAPDYRHAWLVVAGSPALVIFLVFVSILPPSLAFVV